jgi:hypothetical protein
MLRPLCQQEATMPDPFTAAELRWLLHATNYQRWAAERRVLKAGAPSEFAKRQAWADRYAGLKVKLEAWLRETDRAATDTP